MHILLGATLSIFFLCSCNSVSSNSKISRKIGQVCKYSDTCFIDMKNIVPGQWDKMYVFTPVMSLEDINKELGFEYKFFNDIANRIVFVKGKEVVYHEDEFPNPEKVKKGELVFDLGDEKTHFKMFVPIEAVFVVKKVDLGNGTFYELSVP